MTTSKIWPGPECPTSGPTVGDLLDLSAMAYGQPTEAERRTRGIALAHVKARARMARFVAWLCTFPACAERADAIDAATHAVSPESAVRDLASDGDGPTLLWFALRVGYDHWRRMGSARQDAGWGVRRDAYERVVDQMLGLGEFVDNGASPEWASLPWQENPEVTPR